MSNHNKKEYFTDIYNCNFNYVYSFVFARTAGDGQMTEEIVQETFAAAWTAMDRYKGKSTYATWLCSIAKNKIFEHYRRRTAAGKLIFTDVGLLEERESDFDMEKVVLDEESGARVMEVLKAIRDIYRYVLVMKYIDEYSVKQIAKILGRTPKAVDGILQRAKNSFTKEYLSFCEREMAHG